MTGEVDTELAAAGSQRMARRSPPARPGDAPARPGDAPAPPQRSSRREQLELLVFLLLILPPIVLGSVAEVSRQAFTITGFATILHDIALTALILFFLWTARDRFSAIGWTPRRLGREIALGAVLYPPLLAVIAAVGWLARAAGLPPPSPPPAALVPRSPAEIVLAAVLVIVVAVAEETIFRGYLLLRLRAVTHSTAAAVALSTLLFAAGHTYSGPAGVVAVAVLGALLALIYLWRGSLVAPIVLHLVQDFLGLVLAPWLGLR
jgi:membrane protease YdiL (CAAX protease family)